MLRNSFLTLACIFGVLYAQQGLAQPWCHEAVDVELGSDWRAELYGEKIFRLSVPAAGLVSIEAQASGAASAWVGRHAGSCGQPIAEVMPVEESVDRIVLAAKAGGALFVKAGGRGARLQLKTSFVQAEVSETVNELAGGRRALHTSFWLARPSENLWQHTLQTGSGSAGSENPCRPTSDVGGRDPEPEVSDPDPDGAHTQSRDLAASVVQQRDPEPEVSDPDPDGVPVNCTPPAGTATPRLLHYVPTCYRAKSDDHGDTRACATPLQLGDVATGELANAWGDDSDIFSFAVAELAQVDIGLVSERAGLGFELKGPSGQRLAVDVLKRTDEKDMVLSSVLAPGRYSLRLTGSSGAYALDLSIRN